MRTFMAIVFCMLSACSEKEHSETPIARPQSMVAAASMPIAASAASTSAPRELSALEKQEPDEIAKSEGLVERQEKTLLLHLLSEKTLELINNEACGEDDSCTFYTYRGLIADKQFFLVNADYYEGGSVFVISRKTGEQVDTIDDPHVSPDGKFVVSASESDAYSDAGVFLWEIVDGALMSRLHFVAHDYQLYRFIRWIDVNNVELVKTAWPPKGECPEGKLAEFSMKLVARNGTWTLEATSDKGKCLQQ